jgi:ribosome-binding factor A
MSNRRSQQVAAAIRDELVEITRKEISDPRIERVGFITFSEVKMSPDHRNATVYVSFMGKDEKSQEVRDALAALQSASTYFHRALVKRLRMKSHPHLSFKYDRGFDKAAQLSPAFQKLEAETKKDKKE